MNETHPLDAAATVPDLAAVFARFASASADARERFAGRLDLHYGPSPAETVDVFEAGPGAPLAIFFHGGYWRRLDKGDFSFIAEGLVPLGVAVASVNYPLAPGCALEEIVARCRAAVDWLIAQAGQFDVDASRISVFGHSAGGHLAAMCAVTTPIHALISLSGLHDLSAVRQSFVNEWLQLDDTRARALSPITHAPAAACRVYATAGERESDAFKAQGRALVDAWSARGCQAEYADSPGDDHFTICERLREPTDPLTRRIASLVR